MRKNIKVAATLLVLKSFTDVGPAVSGGLGARVEQLLLQPTKTASRPDRESKKNDFHWQGRIAPGRAIEIKNVKGNVRAEVASGNEVEVIPLKRGHDNTHDSYGSAWAVL